MTHDIVEYLLSGVGLTSISGGIIWAVKQQGRINGHDALFAEREKQALERHTDIKDRLERIETGIDMLTGNDRQNSRTTS